MGHHVALLGVLFLAVALELVVCHPEHLFKCHNQTTVGVDECCKIPQLVDKTIIEKCKSEHLPRPNNKDVKHVARHGAGSCIAQCVLSAIGGFSGETVNVEGFKKALQPVVKANPAFEKLIDETIEKCHAGLTVDKHFGIPETTVKPTCSAVPKTFINCFYSNLFLNCPATAWTDGNECPVLKDKLNQGCPYFLLRKHEHHPRPT